MARTILLRRSGDIVTTLRVADRTGILAASAPPRAAVPKPRPPSTLLAADQVARPAARRVRRNLVFACAAALFLVVGWIGGGVFGTRDAGTPILAVGAALDQEQGGTTPGDVPGPPSPAPAAPTAPTSTQPSPAKASSSETSESTAKRTTRTASRKPSSAAPAAEQRVDTPPVTTAAAPQDELAKQLQEMLDGWHWGARPNRSGGTIPFGGR